MLETGTMPFQCIWEQWKMSSPIYIWMMISCLCGYRFTKQREWQHIWSIYWYKRVITNESICNAFTLNRIWNRKLAFEKIKQVSPLNLVPKLIEIHFINTIAPHADKERLREGERERERERRERVEDNIIKNNYLWCVFCVGVQRKRGNVEMSLRDRGDKRVPPQCKRLC